MLNVNNIEVAYKKVIQVLRGVSLSVESGRIVALLGANGGGKTTTLKSISGMLKTEEGEVTDGSIEFEGRRLDRLGPDEIAGAGISRAMEGLGPSISASRRTCSWGLRRRTGRSQRTGNGQHYPMSSASAG
jgi:ABC-type branched-subunit amino acid transport system ATPase component